jgi:hypothetical protein
MVIRRRGLGNIAIEIRVRRALRALRASPIDGVLIGGLAMNLYRNPRYTAEIDLLMRCGLPATPPAGFTAIAPDEWQHDASGIPVRLFDAAKIQLTPANHKRVINTATTTWGLRIASRDSLAVIAAIGSCNPVCSRQVYQCRADCQMMLDAGPIDTREWELSDQEVELIAETLLICSGESNRWPVLRSAAPD